MKRIALTILAMVVFVATLCAQDVILPKQGAPITAYNVEAGAKFYFYTAEPSEDSPTLKIAKDSVLMVRKADGTVLAPSPELSAAAPAKAGIPVQSNFPEIKEEDIHGSLIAKGNCVYIPTNSGFDYERAGQERFKQIIKDWDYWVVVDKPEQAHFILQFTTQTEDVDYAWVLIRTRAAYRQEPDLSRNGWNGKWRQKNPGITAVYTSSNEEESENRKAAATLASGIKRMMMDSSSTEAKKFQRYHGKAVDADAPSNNSTFHVIYIQ